MSSYRDGRKGVTLLELLISITVLGIMMVIIARFFNHEVASHEQYIHTTRLRQNVRSVMELITRETKIAGYNPQTISETWIETVQDSLRIKADLNGDSDVEDENEDIIYYYDTTNSSIYRKTVYNDNKEIVLENITSFIYEGRDENGNPTLNSNNIEKLYIAITGKAKIRSHRDSDDGYKLFSMNSMVVVRNLKN